MAKLRIRSIPLSLAEPGMLVARELRNDDGQVLVQGETILSESLIAALLRRNVGHVSVFQEDERSDEELQAERIKVTERLAQLFHNVPQDGVMGTLHRVVLEYRLEKLS